MKETVLWLGLVFPLCAGDLSAQTSFYQGKTLRIVVGYQPGDSHDQWARAYARSRWVKKVVEPMEVLERFKIDLE